MRQGVSRQYSQVQIKTANKGKLIVLLYQGAIRNMRKAVLQMEQKDMEGKGNSLIRAQDIVLELLYALDQKLLDEGNDLAANLQRLYLYCYRRLIHANMQIPRSSKRSSPCSSIFSSRGSRLSVKGSRPIRQPRRRPLASC